MGGRGPTLRRGMAKKSILIFLVLYLGMTFSAIAESGIPGETTADDVLRKDIMANIDMFQQAGAPQCEYKVTDTKVKSIDKSSGLSVTREEWTVTCNGHKIVYEIELDQSPNGGTDYLVTAPPGEVYERIKKKGE